MAFSAQLGIMIVLLHTRVLAQEPGVVKTVAGGGKAHEGGKADCVDNKASAMDGIGTDARFNYPWGIEFDPEENVLYVADCGCPETVHSNDRIRKIDVNTGRVTTLAGGAQGYKDGKGEDAKFHHTSGMAIDQVEKVLYVADSGNDRIRKIDLKTAQVTSFAGSGEPGFHDDVGIKAKMTNPQQLEIDNRKKRLFLSDTDNHAIRIISLSDGKVTTFVGGSQGLADGIGKEAKFYHPTGISLDVNSGILYVADHYNHVIRAVDVNTGQVKTLAGGGREGFKDGVGKEARFNYPEGVYFDTDHNILYVVEFDSNAVRIVTPTGEVRTLAGGTEGYRDGVGKQAKFFHPTGLTFDHKRKIIYVTDQYNHMVRSITGVGSTVVDPNKSVLSRTLEKTQSSPYLFACFVFSVAFLIVVALWFRRSARYLLRTRLI
ncbi:NHL repeat-containing protein 2-like isoform X2 [Oculina patagonica]